MKMGLRQPPEGDVSVWAPSQALLAVSRDPVLIVRHHDHRILAASPSAERVYQLSPQALCGLCYDDLVTDPAAVDDIFLQHREHVPLRFHHRADGSRFPVDIRIRWLDDAGGEVGYFRIHDLTRLEQEEQRLRAAEATYSAIFQSAPYAALLLDRRGSVADANDAALGLYRHSREALIGTPMVALLKNARAARLYFSQPRWSATDEWHIRADGSEFPADVVVSQVRGVGHFHAIVMVRDVTEERAMTARLKASEARWRFALEGHGDALWDWDIVRNTYDVSRELSVLLDRIAVPQLHTPADWNERVHPADRGRLSRALVAHLKGQTSLVDVEVRLRKQGEGDRWVWMRGCVLERDADGRAMRMLGSVRDVHDQKMQAEELARWREQVQHTERLTSMGELAATLAHELNQPLTSIRNFSAAALKRLDQEALRDPAEVRRAVQHIADEALRAGRIIQQMRGFVRKGPRRVERTPVAELLLGVQRLAEMRAARMDASIDLDLDTGLPDLLVDRTLAEQLLLNLINNSLEAMLRTPGPRHVTVSACAPAPGSVKLAVSDTGCGLPESHRGEMYTPFFTTKADGLGMGLAICHSIIEAHQGRIWAEANEGGGTTFFVTLPCTEAYEDAAEEAPTHLPG